MIKNERKRRKIFLNIARIVVGVLFIFSGLVKANDPLGLSFKMQEFFDVWSQNASLSFLMHWLDNYALSFSIIMITLEIIVGVALLIGWNPKFISRVLIVLIVFFTFLTGYAVLSGKIRTCGCFGDCIPITAMGSFIKDLILLVLIVIIFFGWKFIKPVTKPGVLAIIIICSTLIVIFFQWYVLRHLPLKDCLPFKIGNNILEQRKMPKDAIPDKVDFIFVYQKNGKSKEFGKDKLPDSTWTFVKRQDIVIQKGSNNEPPIKDFYLNTLSGSDTTEALLNEPGNYYLFFIKNPESETAEWINDLAAIYKAVQLKGLKLYVIATQATEVNELLNEKNHYNVQVLSCDATALKTASRTDPSLYEMNGPVVKGKWGWADFQNVIK